MSEPTPSFTEGQIVRRVEEGAPRRATVVKVDHKRDPGDYVYFLAYAEGGKGWWPEHGLETWKPEFDVDVVPLAAEPE